MIPKRGIVAILGSEGTILNRARNRLPIYGHELRFRRAILYRYQRGIVASLGGAGVGIQYARAPTNTAVGLFAEAGNLGRM